MFKYTKIIPFYDVDPMRVVWHGNYVKYLEDARCAFLAEKNLTYQDMEDMGYAFPIVEMKIKYIRPCLFEQKIDICTMLVAYDNFLTFKYEIQDAQTHQKLCTAETKQMCISIETKETLFEIPEIIQKKLENK